MTAAFILPSTMPDIDQGEGDNYPLVIQMDRGVSVWEWLRRTPEYRGIGASLSEGAVKASSGFGPTVVAALGACLTGETGVRFQAENPLISSVQNLQATSHASAD